MSLADPQNTVIYGNDDVVELFSELEGLVKFIQPFMAHLSKAKAAKMVRELLDLFLDMEVSTGTEVLHVVSSEASPTIWSCYANLNHHYSFH